MCTSPVPSSLVTNPPSTTSNALPATQFQQHMDRRTAMRIVPQCQLVARERRATPNAIRQNLGSLKQEALLKELLEQPPHRLDVLVGVGDVGMFIIQPVGHPVGKRFPVALVLENALTAQPIELFHSQLLLDI